MRNSLSETKCLVKIVPFLNSVGLSISLFLSLFWGNIAFAFLSFVSTESDNHFRMTSYWSVVQHFFCV